MLRSKREIVVVSAAGLALAYAVYAYAYAPKRPATATTAAARPTAVGAMGRLIAETQMQVGRTTISPLVRLAAGRAGEEWSSVLFLAAPLPGELIEREAARKEQQQAAQTVQQQAEASRRAVAEQERLRIVERQKRFSYTGYLCSEGRMLAVINGAVYAVGERLDGPAECFLRTVSPESIAVEDRAAAITVQVPILQEASRERPATGQNGEP